MRAGKYQLSVPEYDKVDAIRSSVLCEVARSPAHARVKELNIFSGGKKSESLVLGTQFHTYLLEPEKFKKEVYVIKDPKAKKDKELMEALEYQYGKENLITPDLVSQLESMKRSVFAHKDAKRIIESLDSIETSLIWEESGVKCKARYDGFNFQMAANVDIKTTLSAHPHDFARSVANYGYDIQAAHYIKGARVLEIFDDIPNQIWIAVEKEPPFAVAVYSLDDESLANATMLRANLLGRYAEAKTNGIYPAYSDNAELLRLPEWRFRRGENEQYE